MVFLKNLLPIPGEGEMTYLVLDLHCWIFLSVTLTGYLIDLFCKISLMN